MASDLLVEDVPDELMERLIASARQNGRSISDEVIAILRAVLMLDGGEKLET